MGRGMRVPPVLAWLAAACSPQSSGGGGSTSSQPEPPRPARVLVTALRVEPKTIAARGLGQNTGVALYMPQRMFNGDLAVLDVQGTGQAYLADALSQLNSDSSTIPPD